MRKDIIGVVVGFVIGGVISYLYCKKRFDEGCCAGVEESSVDEIEKPFDVEDASTRQRLRRECIDIAYEDKEDERKIPAPRSYNKIVTKLYGSDKNEPHVITESEFNDEYDTHDKCTVLYYDEGIITDEHDEVMTNIEETFGNNLSLFGYGSDDKDVLYIRNDKLGIDYELLRQNTTYRTND
jgi:hypothetical protein